MSDLAAISRANGAKSNGPVTEEGKARSSQNSLKHGLFSTTVVLPHENQEEFDQLHQSISNDIRPVSALERDLVQEMAASRWRLRRLQEMESALFLKATREHMEALGAGADPAEARMLAYAGIAGSQSFRTLARYANQLRRAYEKAKDELEKKRQSQTTVASKNEPVIATQNFSPVPQPARPMSYRDFYEATLPLPDGSYNQISLLPDRNPPL
jgi:hypothetical protein